MRSVKIAPSLLSADFSCLSKEIKNIEAAGADMVHFDIMDGHFVPNITIGPLVVKAIRPVTSLSFDVHLMISNPEKYIQAFYDAGADIVTVHLEASSCLYRLISDIKSKGIKAGLALNPATPLCLVESILEELDLLLIMTVEPGFASQSFIQSSVDKIRKARKLIDSIGKDIYLEVDGGINLQTSSMVTKAGANLLVAGNAIFNAEEDMGEIIKRMKGEF